MSNYVIYCITNIQTNKKYIGKTGQKPQRRFNDHMTKGSRSKQKTYFHNAIKKYGKDSFVLSILEENILCEYEAYQREIYWVDHFNTVSPNGYNSTSGGRGGSKASNLTKQKLSRRKRNYIPWNKNRILSLSYHFNLANVIRKRENVRYKVTFENGSEIIIDKLNDFCVSNGYNQGNVSSVLSGKLKKHKDIIKVDRLK